MITCASMKNELKKLYVTIVLVISTMKKRPKVAEEVQ